jgi:hypothetical protein
MTEDTASVRVRRAFVGPAMDKGRSHRVDEGRLRLPVYG